MCRLSDHAQNHWKSVTYLTLVLFIFGRPYYRSSLWYSMSSVCLSSVVHRLSVTFCIVAKRCVLAKKCLVSEGVNRKPGSKSSFLGSPPYFYFRFRRCGHRDGCFCLIFARTAQQSILDGTNWLSSSKPARKSICVRIVGFCGQNWNRESF